MRNPLQMRVDDNNNENQPCPLLTEVSYYKLKACEQGGGRVRFLCKYFRFLGPGRRAKVNSERNLARSGFSWLNLLTMAFRLLLAQLAHNGLNGFRQGTENGNVVSLGCVPQIASPSIIILDCNFRQLMPKEKKIISQSKHKVEKNLFRTTHNFAVDDTILVKIFNAKNNIPRTPDVVGSLRILRSGL